MSTDLMLSGKGTTTVTTMLSLALTTTLMTPDMIQLIVLWGCTRAELKCGQNS